MKIHTLAKKLQLSIGLVFVVASSFALAGNLPGNVTWEKFKQVEFVPKAAVDIPEKQANLVFYRNEDGKSDQSAVNIGINDRYQTSLLSGAYTTVTSCASKTVISTETTSAKTNNLQIDGLAYQFEEGKNYYFEVLVDDNDVARAISVNEAVGLAHIKGKPMQSHTISRVKEPNCMEEPVVVEEPVEKQVYKDVYYFDFDARTLSVSEQNHAQEFVQNVSAANINNYLVYISGFADPMGSGAYNMKLSSDRAEAVKNAYISYGLPAEKIKLEYFGDMRPVVENCNVISNRAQRNECNAKNRRVTIQITEQ